MVTLKNVIIIAILLTIHLAHHAYEMKLVKKHYPSFSQHH